ncbi:DNA-binding GntR family transcriptional regulator [Rhodoligotrophos appendicifer]|uniref:GntR family transcriptional regulator n=1 Tax=Rhodoligotrophos appendicifer TaxID=987056 RepID=UPI00117FA949|nr:GntR family transcriptional regulator [Rhodoligotrophos appendicifer]
MADSPSSGVLAPVKQEAAPLRRRITIVLRDAIGAGVLPQGSRLVEKDLCRDLNVSRTSLREALRELEAEGLVTHQPNRGLIVTRISRAEAENVYRVRAALEALVAEQFAETADASAIAALKRRGAELRQAYATGDMRIILEAKKVFYECFCEGAGNTLVLDLLKRLNSRITQLRGRSLAGDERKPESLAEIDALLAALEARDAPAARAAALLHVQNAARSALATLIETAEEPRPATA